MTINATVQVYVSICIGSCKINYSFGFTISLQKQPNFSDYKNGSFNTFPRNILF